MVRHFATKYRRCILIAASAVAAVPIVDKLQIVDRFFEFSHAHESWDLDEIVVVSLVATVALAVSLVSQSRDLRRALSERDIAEKEAQRLARHDALTGLPNRRAFAEFMETQPPVSGSVLMMLDLDRFKAINDIHGHLAGDAVLTEVSERLLATVGGRGFPARLGGDEFAIMLEPAVDVGRAERLARRLLTAIAQTIEWEGISVTVHASIGMAQLPENRVRGEALHQADQALYTAKKAGRATFAWYDSVLDEAARRRIRLEQDLRNAVAEDRIECEFQALVDLKSGEVRGFETLARWTHPERGRIPPEEFIAIAEDIGIVSALGWNVMRRACRIAAGWDPKLKIAVNFSPLQFRDGELVPTICRILEETGMPAERLEIELTESAIMVDFDLARRSIEELRALGISLALDDFGTGFSSLAHLRKLPFDRIKIDRSFISNIDEHAEKKRIVNGILALAHGMDLAVTAEGIETEADHAFLLSSDCQLGQGFLLAHPMPAEDIAWNLETRWSHHGEEPEADDVPRRSGTAGA